MERTNWITKYNKEHNNEYGNYVFSGRYLAISLPSHPKARTDGYVYIHQLQAEKKLGRYLKDGECVHHINKDKYDNDLDNLIVFKTVSDHTAFHNGCEIALDGDVYIAINKQLKNEMGYLIKICPICNTNTCYYTSNMCDQCRRIKSRKVKRPSYDELLNLILNKPFVAIGKIFGVSDNTIRKWCKVYGLPTKYKDIKMLKLKS